MSRTPGEAGAASVEGGGKAEGPGPRLRCGADTNNAPQPFLLLPESRESLASLQATLALSFPGETEPLLLRFPPVTASAFSGGSGAETGSV